MTESNRFGTPAKERFSKEQAHIVNAKIQHKVRTDYKGARKQVGFRLSLDILNDLAFIQFVTNATQGSIVEETLRIELKKRKDLLRKENEKEYDQLVKLFEKQRKIV